MPGAATPYGRCTGWDALSNVMALAAPATVVAGLLRLAIYVTCP